MHTVGPGSVPPEGSYRFLVPSMKNAPPESSQNSSSSSSVGSEATKALISYIFPDFNAVKYFQKEFSMMNEFHLVEETVCSGFEIYLVDQWIRSRKIGTVVSAYHGNDEVKVKVIKFTILKKPSKQYPPRFQEYLNEVMLNHATFKRRDTDPKVGQVDLNPVPEFLLVTNISALPSNLNLIPIPSGDTRTVESTYLVNSNLRKLNCGGRSLSLIADKVSDASEDKFRQMYRVYNSSVPIKFAVKELVNLIQTCLFYFDLLDARYCDGLLCLKTEDAIKNWWNLIGLPHFNTKPNLRAGILPSKTVAAIISLTISVKIRLQIFGGCDVPKDPFDFENFMISIGQFQKQVKIEKRRKLDLLTLLRLFYFTNRKVNSDSTKQNFGMFGNDMSMEDVDGSIYSSTASAQHSSPYLTNSASSQNPSAYKRNKLYYSKELKKLTNVVKNTVQDHIIVREDDDDFYADASKVKPHKLRNKIVSKLSESLDPAEVETIDLDVLVRKFLVGVTLLKLWQGLPTSSGQGKSLLRDDGRSPLTVKSRHPPHHHRQHQSTHHYNGRQGAIKQHMGVSAHDDDPKYQFVSLRDAIAQTQECPNIPDRAGRLGRMKYALQGKKSAPLQKLDMWSDMTKSQEAWSASELGSSLLDAELQRISNVSSNPIDSIKEDGITEERCVQRPRHTLNRRGSYPFMNSSAEVNLSTLVYLKNENLEGTKNLPMYSVGKCGSFSALEDYFCGLSELYSLEKARIGYTDCVSKLLVLDCSKRAVADYENTIIDKGYKHINMELVKLQNLKSHMDSKKSVIDKDYSQLLRGRMKDLADNIDRMAFRSRDLLKKINELEGNAKRFEFKLDDECHLKLDDIVDGLIHSNKFRNVFKDEDERQRLIFELNGHDYRAERGDEREESLWGFRALIVFLYEMMAFVLQVFNFDRSKMNLDRIRKQYGKLDPNRRYINKAYNFIGRDLVSMLRSSTSETPTNEPPVIVAGETS